jgi:hypothetical protein
MNDLYEALEVSLQEIERGTDLDTVLFRYPDLADELRPILEASVNAKRMAVPAPSADMLRRNRARVLRHATQMREARSRASGWVWFASLRRIAVTLAVVAMLLISGTNLVSAASATLPGDNLYPIKRTWEDVLLLFTFDLQQREALEIEHENERLHELREIFAEGRAAEVEFAGLVTQQNGKEWVVSGVPVVISDQTEVRDGPIVIGSAVRVKGETMGNGVVLAERVRLLPPDANLPAVDIEEDDDDHPGPGSGDSAGRDDDHSGPGSGDESPEQEDSSGSGRDLQDDGSGSEDDNNNGSDSSKDKGNDDSGKDDSSGSSGGDDSSDESNDDLGGGDNSGSGGGGEDNE